MFSWGKNPVVEMASGCRKGTTVVQRTHHLAFKIFKIQNLVLQINCTHIRDVQNIWILIIGDIQCKRC